MQRLIYNQIVIHSPKELAEFARDHRSQKKLSQAKVQGDRGEGIAEIRFMRPYKRPLELSDGDAIIGSVTRRKVRGDRTWSFPIKIVLLGITNQTVLQAGRVFTISQ